MTEDQLEEKLQKFAEDINGAIALARKSLETLEKECWSDEADIENKFRQVVGDMDEATAWFSEVTESMQAEWVGFNGFGEETCGYCDELLNGDKHKGCAAAEEAGV